MEYQVRRYRIADGHMDDFVAAWQAGVVPLRRAVGFSVEAAYVIEGGDFVWILGYDGPGDFAAADERYYASDERAAIDPDPAQWIEHGEETPARRVL